MRARYGAPVNEFQPLIDQLYREEVERARKLGPEGRLRECIELSEMNLAFAAAHEPKEMARRYRIYCAIREQGCYAPPVPRT